MKFLRCFAAGYAEDDLRAAEILLGQCSVPRTSCFHAQQGAEKAIKATFVFLMDFPFTHDLDRLRDRLPEGWAVKEDFPDLAGLSKWTVEPRYPGDVIESLRGAGYVVPGRLAEGRCGINHNMILFYDIVRLNAKHRKTLAAVFESPVRSDVEWSSVERLFVALGAEMSEGRGSRVRVYLNGTRAVFHRPHPEKETDKGALKSVRRFLEEAGIEPEG